jgi:hypothetical protein
MENGIVTWLIVIGLILLQFLGSNKKRKAAEARKKAIMEEQMRRAAETSEYNYEDSSEEEIDYEEAFQEEPQAAKSAQRNYSEDPFDFLTKIKEQVEVMMSVDKSYYDIEEKMSGRPSSYQEAIPSIETETYEQRSYSDNVESGVVFGDSIVEGVRTTEDDADAIGGVNDEAGLYNAEYEARNVVSPVVASFDPKLFILYSEIARPKFQE